MGSHSRSRSSSSSASSKASGGSAKQRSRSPGRERKNHSKSRSRSRSRSESRSTYSRSPSPSKCKRLHIANLDESVRRRDIEETFSKYGKLADVWMASYPPFYAFVVYERSSDANDALKDMRSGYVRSCHVRTSVALPRQASRRGAPPRRYNDRDRFHDRERSPHRRRRSPHRRRRSSRTPKRSSSRSPKRSSSRSPKRSSRRERSQSRSVSR